MDFSKYLLLASVTLGLLYILEVSTVVEAWEQNLGA